MAIYIKDMKMPKGCRDCQFEDWGKCIAIRPIRTTRHMSEEREVYCPLTEVPEPHGRLIDGDALEEKRDNTHFDDALIALQYDNVLIATAPTIIEGSEE